MISRLSTVVLMDDVMMIMLMMISIPPAGDVRPIDVGFTAAAQNSTLPAASTDPELRQLVKLLRLIT